MWACVYVCVCWMLYASLGRKSLVCLPLVGPLSAHLLYIHKPSMLIKQLPATSFFWDSKALISIFSHSLCLCFHCVCVCERVRVCLKSSESTWKFLWRVKLTFSDEGEGGELFSAIFHDGCPLIAAANWKLLTALWSWSDREQSFTNSIIYTYGAQELKNWPVNMILNLKLL